MRDTAKCFAEVQVPEWKCVHIVFICQPPAEEWKCKACFCDPMLGPIITFFFCHLGAYYNTLLVIILEPCLGSISSSIIHSLQNPFSIHFRKFYRYLLSPAFEGFLAPSQAAGLACLSSALVPNTAENILFLCFCLSVLGHFDKILSVSLSYTLLWFVSFKSWASRAVVCNHNWILESLEEIFKLTHADFPGHIKSKLRRVMEAFVFFSKSPNGQPMLEQKWSDILVLLVSVFTFWVLLFVLNFLSFFIIWITCICIVRLTC